MVGSLPLSMVQMSNFYLRVRNTNRRLPAPTNQGPSALGTNVKFLPSCFFETKMYRMENGTLRMGILKTKGLRPLVQNHFPFAIKTFSKIRGILELNQTKSANGRTDELTQAGLVCSVRGPSLETSTRIPSPSHKRRRKAPTTTLLHVESKPNQRASLALQPR